MDVRDEVGQLVVNLIQSVLPLGMPLDELEQVRHHLPLLMCEVASLRVPLVAEVGVGPNWEQAH